MAENPGRVLLGFSPPIGFLNILIFSQSMQNPDRDETGR
ncbi:uncharacterized protein METZ01_LOCUS190618 [marine metagenome]|uniref:Uncharacterized protein n=1 Tax=marine metagenome TaxID=408172 RepID=A0A382DIE5_9ZZZZ